MKSLTANVGISIVVPCYNEEVSLPRFLEEMTKTMDSLQDLLCSPLITKDSKNYVPYEFVFVNDGSKDKTLEILYDIQAKDTHPNRQIRIYSFSRNFGKEAAILAGLKNAYGDEVILLDAD